MAILGQQLDKGDRLPSINWSLLDGSTFNTVTDLAPRWTVICILRGHWCPYCRQQAVDYQRLYPEFQANDIGVMLACSENRDISRKLVNRLGLSLPYAYGLDVEDHSRLFGCFYDFEEQYIQATGFIIDPEGKIFVSAYSSGMVGRIRAENALSIIRYYQTEDAEYLPDI